MTGMPPIPIAVLSARVSTLKFMLLRRGLRTSAPRPSSSTRQPLFAPYVSPLNEKQKKVIRRVALLDAPNFHLARHKDAEWVISASKRTQQQCDATTLMRNKLRQIVIEELGEGNRRDVVNVGADAWVSDRARDALFEFAIAVSICSFYVTDIL